MTRLWQSRSRRVAWRYEDAVPVVRIAVRTHRGDDAAAGRLGDVSDAADQREGARLGLPGLEQSGRQFAEILRRSLNGRS
jgi:hypothetical protein